MCIYLLAFHAGSVIKNLPTNAGDAGSGRIFLARKDPPKKEMEAHFFFLSWKIPWTEELGGLQFRGHERVGYNLATKQQHISIPICVCIHTRRCLSIFGGNEPLVKVKETSLNQKIVVTC